MKELIDDAMDRIVEVISDCEKVTFVRAGMPEISFLAIFHDPSSEVSLAKSDKIMVSPTLSIRKEDVGINLRDDDRFIIRDKLYQIKSLSRDGYGNIELELWDIDDQR